ncbi:MAG: sigma 54-interacting transcriptional regulator, partial [bacterium]
MTEGRILIFNPCQHPLGNDVYKIIINETKHRVFVLEKLPSDSEKNYQAHLIFTIFASCKHTCDQLFNLLFDIFPLIPSIAILNSQDVCLNCPILERRIWNLISTPFSKEDILLNIQKYLPFSFVHNPSKMMSNIKLKGGCELLKGKSSALQQVKEKIYQVAPFDVTVLLSGETGTGKELCAKMIHFLSNRSNKPFIAINCGTIPKDLFENELFGHKKGAFTHANESQFGLI